MQAWIMLAGAGLLEIVWAIGLKYADGFTKPVPTTITIAAMAASMWLLAMAARSGPASARSARHCWA
jgi:quaternary ammonium compound-resistance protein SugE